MAKHIDVNAVLTLCRAARLDPPFTSRPTLYRRMDDAGFPRPVAFAGVRKLWERDAVIVWIDQRKGNK